MRSLSLVSATLRRSLPAATARSRGISSYQIPRDDGDEIFSNEIIFGDDRDDLEPPGPPEGSFPIQNHPENPLRAATGINDTLRRKTLQAPRYRLCVKSSRNNTIAAFTKPDGDILAWFSGGKCGFKGANKAGYEAGYQCAVRVFEKITEQSKVAPLTIELFFKGFGQGRDAVCRALLSTEGESVRPMVVTITDRTPIKIGGTRSPKMRRL
jgi:small subunit ribosomal protein S11